MKTAVQELEEILKDNLKDIIVKKDYKLMEILFSNALEKEKEQIVNAFKVGYKACDIDEALEINKTMFSGDRYYNQTYK